jgi:hypothetical protein
MIETVINYLNLRIETLGRVVHRHVLTERRKRGGDGVVVPYAYVGAANYQPVDIGTGSLSWWRARSGFSFEPISVTGRALRQRRAVYPLRLLAIIRRENSTADNAFAPSRFAEDLAEAIREEDGDLRALLLAEAVSVRVTGVDFDTPKVWREEFETPVDDLDYAMCMVALDVNVEVTANPSCWQSECDREADILRLFNFCDASVVARLTPTQVECLEAALCELTPCDPATVSINGTEVGQAPSGGQFNANVTLDGLPSGAWDGVDTWQVVSPPCADGNVEINGDAVATVASGGMVNIMVEQDGNPIGAFDPDSNSWVIPPCPDASWSLVDTDGNQLDNGTIPSGGSDTITAPNASYTLLDTDTPPNVLDSGSILSQGSANIIAPAVTVTRDSQPFAVVPAGQSVDVPSNCAPPQIPYIGGKAIYPAGDGFDFFEMQVNLPNGRLNTYGLGFMFRYPNVSGNRQILSLGYTMQNNNSTYSSREAIYVWGTATAMAVHAHTLSNNSIQFNTSANTNFHLYIQFKPGVHGTDFGVWLNGVWINIGAGFPAPVQNVNFWPLVSGALRINRSTFNSSYRECYLWDIMVTNGQLTPAEITAMANASIAGTDPSAGLGSKCVELIDFGQNSIGVPSNDTFNPTITQGIRGGSIGLFSKDFTAPHGIVAIP